MYESMVIFALFIAALTSVLSLFGCTMAVIGNARLWKRWNKIDNLCDRRDELYMKFIQDGWTPPTEHRFRGFYNFIHQEPALAMAA